MLKTGRANPFYCVLICTSPGNNSGFFTLFAEFFSSVFGKFDKVLIVGDFDIHVDNASDKFGADFFFLQLIHASTCMQHVLSLTHNYGHKL